MPNIIKAYSRMFPKHNARQIYSLKQNYKCGSLSVTLLLALSTKYFAQLNTSINGTYWEVVWASILISIFLNHRYVETSRFFLNTYKQAWLRPFQATAAFPWLPIDMILNLTRSCAQRRTESPFKHLSYGVKFGSTRCSWGRRRDHTSGAEFPSTLGLCVSPQL